jgi:TctA family transporter
MTGDFLGNLAIGVHTALTLSNLLYCLIGVIVGMLIGVLPGIGVMAALSMLFPLTFYLDPAGALIMLAGIWYGGGYGGSIAAILLNVPGAPSSAVTSLDGYPMARQGRAGIALLMTSLSSFVGGSVGILMLMLFAPFIAQAALQFGPTEYFALMLMGLVAASSVSTGSTIKGLAMVLLGLLLGTVGTDIATGVRRFDFGVLQLSDGINLAALAMGLFGISEVITTIRSARAERVDPKVITLRSMLPTKDDRKRFWARRCAAPRSAPSSARCPAPARRSPPSFPTRSKSGWPATPSASARAPSRGSSRQKPPTTRPTRPHSSPPCCWASLAARPWPS